LISLERVWADERSQVSGESPRHTLPGEVFGADFAPYGKNDWFHQEISLDDLIAEVHPVASIDELAIDDLTPDEAASFLVAITDAPSVAPAARRSPGPAESNKWGSSLRSWNPSSSTELLVWQRSRRSTSSQ
jgi:hypothetical protein